MTLPRTRAETRACYDAISRLTTSAERVIFDTDGDGHGSADDCFDVAVSAGEGAAAGGLPRLRHHGER